jgi:Tfp pilus assembly protein PilF
MIAIRLTALATLLLAVQTTAIAQEREGCFAVFSSGQIVDLNDICDSDRQSAGNPAGQAYQQGYGLSREERHTEAIASFTQAIQLDPNRPEAYVGRAHAQVLTGNRRAAIQDYEQAAILYRRQGNVTQATLLQAMAEEARTLVGQGN